MKKGIIILNYGIMYLAVAYSYVIVKSLVLSAMVV